jgi:hypothetical protein
MALEWAKELDRFRKMTPEQQLVWFSQLLFHGKVGVRSCIMTTVRYTSPYGLTLAIRASSCAVSCSLP